MRLEQLLIFSVLSKLTLSGAINILLISPGLIQLRIKGVLGGLISGGLISGEGGGGL